MSLYSSLRVSDDSSVAGEDARSEGGASVGRHPGEPPTNRTPSGVCMLEPNASEIGDNSWTPRPSRHRLLSEEAGRAQAIAERDPAS